MYYEETPDGRARAGFALRCKELLDDYMEESGKYDATLMICLLQSLTATLVEYEKKR